VYFSHLLSLSGDLDTAMSNLVARDGISSVQPPLSQAVGYVVVVVIGVIIALGK
jgi:hypothetical protein